MPDAAIRIHAVKGIPEISPGDNLGGLIVQALRRGGTRIVKGDIFVITQKVVSKSEGRIVPLDSVEPSPKSVHWAEENGKDPRIIELVLREARRIVRMERGVLIVETHHGFVCANAGVDVSNTQAGTATLLPVDPDASAQRLKKEFEGAFGSTVGVIISDTFGRPWREGLVNVAIGVAGVAAIVDYRGQTDSSDRALQATVMAIADELASAAELVMGKISRVPVAIIQGFSMQGQAGSGRDLLRPADRDLFR